MIKLEDTITVVPIYRMGLLTQIFFKLFSKSFQQRHHLQSPNVNGRQEPRWLKGLRARCYLFVLFVCVFGSTGSWNARIEAVVMTCYRLFTSFVPPIVAVSLEQLEKKIQTNKRKCFDLVR